MVWRSGIWAWLGFLTRLVGSAFFTRLVGSAFLLGGFIWLVGMISAWLLVVLIVVVADLRCPQKPVPPSELKW